MPFPRAFPGDPMHNLWQHVSHCTETVSPLVECLVNLLGAVTLAPILEKNRAPCSPIHGPFLLFLGRLYTVFLGDLFHLEDSFLGFLPSMCQWFTLYLQPWSCGLRTSLPGYATSVPSPLVPSCWFLCRKWHYQDSAHSSQQAKYAHSLS